MLRHLVTRGGLVFARLISPAVLLAGLLWPQAGGAGADEPGLEGALDEPGLELTLSRVPAPADPAFERVRVELAFGYASMLADPDIAEGYGGGLFVGVWLHRRVGLEASLFVSNNNFTGQLGDTGMTFVAGSITGGPMIRLTPPGGRIDLTIDLGLGGYLAQVIPTIQDSVWTLGVVGGLTFGVRVTRWLGIGFKWRYHLFNLSTISGPELRDVAKSYQTLGVIDRMELPAYVAFYL